MIASGNFHKTYKGLINLGIMKNLKQIATEIAADVKSTSLHDVILGSAVALSFGAVAIKEVYESAKSFSEGQIGAGILYGLLSLGSASIFYKGTRVMRGHPLY